MPTPKGPPDTRHVSPHASRVRILIAFAVIYVIWGSTYLGIRIAIESIPPLLMAGIRYFTAGIALFAWTRLRGAEAPTLVHWRSTASIGALLLLGGNGGVSWGVTRVATGLAALLIATVPLWIVTLQWLGPGHRRPGVAMMAGLALGLVGLALLVGLGPALAGRPPDPVGAAVILGGALSWSIGSLTSRRAPLPRSPLLGIAMEMMLGGAMLALVGLALGEGARFHPGAVSLRSLLALAYLISFGSLIGFTAYVWLLRVSAPSKVATYAFVNPIVALLLGAAFAGERLTPRTTAAAGVIVAAVAIITLAPGRRA